jgi:hypothetical protein
MEDKYLKDFVIALVVIAILAFAIHDYYLMKKVNQVPDESKYRSIALSDTLLTQIQSINSSIQDRKEFVFNVKKDPLEQNLIVRTKRDLEKQWQEEVARMVRLQSTMISENGMKMATISHKGENTAYYIGDSFKYGEIIDIKEGELMYSYNGKIGTLKVEKLPEKPQEILDDSEKKTREYNW